VNSALQRARVTLGDKHVAETYRGEPLTTDDSALLKRYVAAFEAYDIPTLVALLKEDASISMPPFAMWLRGRQDLHDFYLGSGAGCRGSRLLPLEANGSPAFAHYKPDPAGGFISWSIQVLEVSGGTVSHVHHFLGPALFGRFGLANRM
jgi:RNA polymerase sigma-70 factor (ECF subfamily)